MKKYRILIVDDNHASAKTMGWAIEMLGHEYQLAHNGASAITIAQTFQPEIVLLDIGLPGMDGYEVCKQLRQNPDLAKTIFIAQTGWSDEEHRQASKEAGFHQHLVKPIPIERLEDILEEIAAA